MTKREAKIEKYNRPKRERKREMSQRRREKKERKNWKDSADPKVKS
jgi:hypothetical protein